MGFFKKGKLRKRSEKRERINGSDIDEHGQVKQGDLPKQNSYSLLKKENEPLQSYYDSLHGREKSEIILDALRSDLPTTYRINRDVLTDFIKNLIDSKYLSNVEFSVKEDERVKMLEIIPWYPDNLAYAFDVSRWTFKKTPALKELHNLLVNFTESGHISRHEAVSMIPALLLDARPGEKVTAIINHYFLIRDIKMFLLTKKKVLDICAAPGSKTAQILECLQSEDSKSGKPDKLVDDGSLLIANDSNLSRCYTLVRQSKRLRSFFLIVTHLDAQFFPTITLDSGKSFLQFDKILADVPCSGDGTLRKNLDIWKNWTPSNGNGLHKVQVSILTRAMALTKINGTIVYSTCSMYPIENEAVICAAIKRSRNAFEVIDVRDKLNGLRVSPGVKNWKVMDKHGVFHEKYSKELMKVNLCQSMFPQDEEDNSVNISNCIRIEPQEQNTGGFFIAVLRKKAPFGVIDNSTRSSLNQTRPDETRLETSPPSSLPPSPLSGPPGKSESPAFDKKPFVTITLIPSNSSLSKSLRTLFGLPLNSLWENAFATHSTDENCGSIYLVSPLVARILTEYDKSKLRPVSAGVKCFVRSGKNKSDYNSYRFSEGGINAIAHLVSSSRKIQLNTNDILAYLSEENPKTDAFSPSFREIFPSLSIGGYVGEFCAETSCVTNGKKIELKLPIWISKCSTSLLVKKEYRNVLRYICTSLGTA